MKSTIIASLTAVILLSLTSCHKQTIDDVAEKEVESLNQNCPFNLSDEIRNDSVAYNRTTHTFTYYFTLMGELDSFEYIEANKSAFHEQLEAGLVNQPGLDPYIREGLSFRYVYYSASEPQVIRYEDVFTFNK